MQGAEIWEELGEWVTDNNPQFGPGIKERFQAASKLTLEEVGCQADIAAGRCCSEVCREASFQHDCFQLVPIIISCG